jgi:hypothetical protein
MPHEGFRVRYGQIENRVCRILTETDEISSVIIDELLLHLPRDWWRRPRILTPLHPPSNREMSQRLLYG